MKVNELRIGNFVTAIRCDRSKFVDSIYKVQEEGVTTKIGWNEIEPIPLNEEWLEKLGWVYEGYNYDYYDNDKEQRVFESRNSLGDFIEFEGYFLPMPYYFNQAFGENFKLKYVHQLQNLYFALIGEELTIKN